MCGGIYDIVVIIDFVVLWGVFVLVVGYGFIYSYLGNKISKRFAILEDGHSVTVTLLAWGVHNNT